MAGSGVPAFSLRVGPFGAAELTVDGFTGTEGLGHLYEFQIDFHGRGEEPLEAAELLGAEALLTVVVPGGVPRYLHGKVRSVQALGRRGGLWRYRVWVVPQLWWLTRVQRSRIFQGKAVPDILQAVLREAGVEVKLSLSGGYAAREYCTQYRETDFAFLSRLMEWEGLFYFFEHTADGHTLVVGDSPSVHEALPGGAALPLREEGGRATEGEYLSVLQRVHRLRPGKVHLKDYDFEKPSLDVSGRAQDGSSGVPALEVYDYPGEYVAPAVARSTARVRLEEVVQAARTLEAEAVCPRLTPGYRFEVEDDGTHAGEYVVVEVRHTGRQPETTGGREAAGDLYRNQLKCMPARVPFRPRRTTPTPHIPGPQTATVVGPAGEEIHTDEHGRIKVQFHWDREGRRDERASCWVRVGQTWAGPGWGALYLPRIGQEVVVRFLEGNPDRPLIAGAVYNGANSTPYTLPDERTKSTLKSASSLGSDGFNEVRIEDAAGEEEIFAHAQKDEELRTENDKDQEVRAYEEHLVKKDRAITVEGNQKLEVRLEDTSLVRGNQSLEVMENRSTLTAASHDEAVRGNQAVTVAQTFTGSIAQGAFETVGGAKALTIGAAYGINVGLALTETVGGLKSVQVGGARTSYVALSNTEQVVGNASTKVRGDVRGEVIGGVQLTVGKDLQHDVQGKAISEVQEPAAWLGKSFQLKADELSIVVNGKRIFHLTKSGEVKIAPSNISLEGSQISFKGKNVHKLEAGSQESGSASKAEIEALETVEPETALGDLYVRLDVPPKEAPLHYDRFILTATDGSFRQELKVKNDAIPNDRSVELLFTGLDKQKRYSLEVTGTGKAPSMLFEDVPYGQLVSAGGRHE
jgi:type VI secretion system secreted protein VgrG